MQNFDYPVHTRFLSKIWIYNPSPLFEESEVSNYGGPDRTLDFALALPRQCMLYMVLLLTLNMNMGDL